MTHSVRMLERCTAEGPPQLVANANPSSLAQWCVDMANELASGRPRGSEPTTPSEEPTTARLKRRTH